MKDHLKSQIPIRKKVKKHHLPRRKYEMLLELVVSFASRRASLAQHLSHSKPLWEPRRPQDWVFHVHRGAELKPPLPIPIPTWACRADSQSPLINVGRESKRPETISLHNHQPVLQRQASQLFNLVSLLFKQVSFCVRQETQTGDCCQDIFSIPVPVSLTAPKEISLVMA